MLQVFHLKEAGIACGYLSGTQEYSESRELLQSLSRDPPGVKILFVTPEKVARSDYLMRTLDGLHSRTLLVSASARPEIIYLTYYDKYAMHIRQARKHLAHLL